MIREKLNIVRIESAKYCILARLNFIWKFKPLKEEGEEGSKIRVTYGKP
jgi:hypothetical protein